MEQSSHENIYEWTLLGFPTLSFSHYPLFFSKEFFYLQQKFIESYAKTFGPK